MEKKLKFALIGIIGTISISILVLTSLGVIDLFGNEFFQYDPNSGITGRPDLLEEVHNITLKVEYVTKPIDIWENFSLYNYKTTVLDALEEKCTIVTNTYGYGVLVLAINGIYGDWIYFVNGNFAGVAASDFKLSSGDYIYWKHINV